MLLFFIFSQHHADSNEIFLCFLNFDLLFAKNLNFIDYEASFDCNSFCPPRYLNHFFSNIFYWKPQAEYESLQFRSSNIRFSDLFFSVMEKEGLIRCNCSIAILPIILRKDVTTNYMVNESSCYILIFARFYSPFAEQAMGICDSKICFAKVEFKLRMIMEHSLKLKRMSRMALCRAT